MNLKIRLLYLLVNLCHGDWLCGDALIEDQAACLCGNETFTRDASYNDDINCCGPDTCIITETGATCPGGQTCKSYSAWPCGDILIPNTAACYCGAEKITDDDLGDGKFCCPSSSPSQCFMTQDGIGHCNGTVKTGIFAGCDTGVCHSRRYFACRSGEKCVRKNDMCHGEPLCDDLSDVMFCNIHNNEVCLPQYDYSKCPYTSSSEHQECYKPSEDMNNFKYNCITRNDEIGSKENTDSKSTRSDFDTVNENIAIDYESIKPCTDEYGAPGLLCGNECKLNTEWCLSEYSTSCKVNTSTFTTDNSVLCQNSKFWSQHGQDCNHYVGDIIWYFGRRCGRVQHCFWPPHRTWHYNHPGPNYPTSCSDLSDQVHEVGTKCNIDKDVQEYCQTFCQTDKQTITDDDIGLTYFIDDKGRKVFPVPVTDCDTICHNKESWISNQDEPEIKDPRNCQSSCSDKDYNCDACTNPEYSFTCKIDGVEHCLHKDHICDGVPACDDASDEKALTSGCIERLAKEKVIKPEAATVICQRNEFYENVETIAVPCNDIIECAYGEDEHWLCKDSQISLVGAAAAFVILFILSIFMKYCHWTITELKISMTVNFKPQKCKDTIKMQVNCESETTYDSEVDNDPLILQDVLDSDVFNRDHDKEEFRNDVNLFIQKCEESDEKTERINKNQKLYELELKKHDGKESETALCIKNTIDPGNAKILLDDAKPGIMRTYFRQIEDFQDWMGKKKTANWAMNKAKNIATIYVDLCKDTYLMIVIYILVGGPSGSLKNFPIKLSSVVVFCQFGSIVGPLLASGILHANDEMKTMNLSFIGKIWKYFLAILKSPLTPLFISKEYDDNKTARRTMIHYNRHRNDVLELMAEGTRVRRSYAKFLRIDLGLELFFQLSGQLILLCLTVTETPTTGGIESLFKKADNFYFGLSVALGFRSIYMAYLKTVAVEKPYFGITSKIVLFAWIMVSATLRLIVLVLYFTPSFGLFSILHHWRKEEIPFVSQYRHQVNKTGMLYLYKTNITKEQWDEIDRYNVEEERGPHYLAYTVFSLDRYFFFFWILLIVHLVLNIFIKGIISAHFRKNCRNILERIVHGLENVNIPSVWRDWDMDKGGITEHKRRRTRVLLEMVAIMVVRSAFHAIMVLPVIITAKNVWRRHELLESTIGILPEEQLSYDNITSVYYVAVVLVPTLSLMEILLYCIYQCKFHPWKLVFSDEILENSETNQETTTETENVTQISNSDMDP